MARYGQWCWEVIHKQKNPTKRQRTLYKSRRSHHGGWE